MDVYIFQADIYCDDCGRDIQAGLEKAVPLDERDDSDRYPQGPYGDGGGEADCPQHCGACRTFLYNPLTGDGEKYVVEKVRSGEGDTEILTQWWNHYSHLF